MKKRLLYKIKRLSAALLACTLSISPAAAAGAGNTGFVLTSYADSRSAVVNIDRLNVRSGPGTSSSKVAVLTSGTAVTVTDETKGSDGYIWYKISWSGGSGYARYDYISINTVYAAADAAFEQWMNTQGFPESYKNGLRGLHQKYPNWVFTAQKTGLDWNTVIQEESKIGRNLVANTSVSSWKSLAQGAFDWAGNYWPGFDGATWVQASTELIAYYMDPRNFLSDPYIYQFELQKYDPSTQTKDGLKQLVAGTFLEGDAIVPIEGSVIEGGTVIEGSVAGVSGSASSSASSSGSSSAAGPGTASTGSNVIGPGSTAGPGSGSSGTGTNTIIAAPGVTTTASSAVSSFASTLESLSGVITSYANWQKDAAGKWVYYDNSSSGFLNNGWNWLDGNNDGISECYYFYPDGSLAVSTVVDGYKVDADGKWIDDSGVIQTKTAAASDSGTVRQEAQLKKVPYVDIIMKAAEESGVSPYVLASAILQEQGKGTSDLISGKNGSYPGYYNFFNIGAYAHDGMSAVTAGLKYASESGSGSRPWNTIEKAIIGGAKLYEANYVSSGQDTFYLKKFNVQGSNKYNHQYMTHVLAAASEGAKVSNAYSDAVKSTALTFKIPVYENMPESTTLPSGDGNPNNKLSSLSVDGYQLTPTFGMDTQSYSLIVDGSAASVNVSATAIDSGAKITGTGNTALNIGSNEINVTVRAANGSERVYKISITRRDNVTADAAGTSTGTASNGGPSPVNTGAVSSGGPGDTVSVSAGSGSADGVIIGQTPQ